MPDWLFLLQGTRSITLQLGGDDVTSPHGPLAPIFAHGADRYMAVYGGQPTHGAGPATVQNSSVAGLDDDDTLVGIDSDPTNPSPHAPLPHHRGSVASSASASRHPSVTPTSTQHLLALPTPTDQTSPIHQGRLAQQRLRALDALVRRRVMRIPGATPEARERQQQLLLIYGRAIAELRKSFAVFYASSAATATGAASGEPRGEPSPMMSTSSGSSPSSFGGGAGAEGSGRAGSGGSSASASGNAPLSLDLSDAFVWLFIVADDFLPLLKPSAGPAQEALAIFAHFCILLKRLDGEWWLQGWGTHLILRCHSLLDDEHRLWIRWPIEEAGIVVSSLA